MTVLASSTFRREPAAVPSARAFVAQTLASLPLTLDVAERLVLAAAEACNNVVLHAEGDTFAVAVAVDDDDCSIHVTDAGGGFRAPRRRPAMPAADETGHRGLALMYALVDRVEVSSSAEGTDVVLVQQVAAAAGATAVPAGGGLTGPLRA
jgi:serine/threonine-protein kinase RsbW